MICPVCHGAQNLMTHSPKRGLEYWPCPCCHGAGVTVLFSPPKYQHRAVPPATPTKE